MMNDTANSSDNETLADLSGFVAFEIFVYSSLIVSVVICNSLLVFVLYARIKVKSFSFLMIRSLALSDLLIGLFPLVCQVVIRADEKFFRDNLWFVLLFNIVDLSQSSVNLVLVFALATHRLLLILTPLKANEKLSVFKRCLILAIWLVTYALWSAFFTTKYFEQRLEFDGKTTGSPAAKVAMLAVYFLAAVVLTIAVVIWIIVLIEKRTKVLRAMQDNNNPAVHAKRDRRVIICLCMIALNVALSQIVFGIYTILNDLGLVDAVIPGKIFNMISYFNAFIDPIIQFSFNDWVRRELGTLKQRFLRFIQPAFDILKRKGEA